MAGTDGLDVVAEFVRALVLDRLMCSIHWHTGEVVLDHRLHLANIPAPEATEACQRVDAPPQEVWKEIHESCPLSCVDVQARGRVGAHSFLVMEVVRSNEAVPFPFPL